MCISSGKIQISASAASVLKMRLLPVFVLLYYPEARLFLKYKNDSDRMGHLFCWSIPNMER